VSLKWSQSGSTFNGPELTPSSDKHYSLDSEDDVILKKTLHRVKILPATNIFYVPWDDTFNPNHLHTMATRQWLKTLLRSLSRMNKPKHGRVNIGA